LKNVENLAEPATSAAVLGAGSIKSSERIWSNVHWKNVCG
jgi:hypothetical protein